MTKHIKIGFVRQAARGRWDFILSRLIPELPERALTGRVHVDCIMPEHGGKHDFRLDRNVAERGGAICTCGSWPDGFALLQARHRWTFPQVKNEVAAVLGLTASRHGPLPPRNSFPPRDKDERYYGWLRDTLNRMWSESLVLAQADAEPARLYLRRRGLPFGLLMRSGRIRFHSRLKYVEEGNSTRYFPGLITKVESPHGEPVTLHRTFLTTTGDKAPVTKARRMMPVIEEGRTLIGGAVRLVRPGRVLGVAEGIETAASVIVATGMSVWAALSTSLMAAFEPPEGVEEVWIWADKDRRGGGEQAAVALQQRLVKRGLRARILLPGHAIAPGAKSVDWNDVLLQKGVRAFPKVSRRVRIRA